MLQIYPEENGSRIVMFSNNKYSGFERRKVSPFQSTCFGYRITIAVITDMCFLFVLYKLFEILDIITRELGSVEIREDKLLSSKIFLYVTSKKKVVGCVIAEQIKQAYRATRRTASSHAN